MIHYPAPFKKAVSYFWGYQNHVINDTTTELPIREITKKANVSEIRITKALIREAKNFFDLNIEVVTGDANYDAEDLLKFIVKELEALAIIPHNPRNEQPNGYQIKDNKVICEAGLNIYRKGKIRPKNTRILYCQYPCPIYYDKQIWHHYLMCPLFHPKFLNGKGCNALMRLKTCIRAEINCSTRKFKELYNKRTSVERIFSHLLSLAMQNQQCAVIMPIVIMQRLHILRYY